MVHSYIILHFKEDGLQRIILLLIAQAVKGTFLFSQIQFYFRAVAWKFPYGQIVPLWSDCAFGHTTT